MLLQKILSQVVKDIRKCELVWKNQNYTAM